MEVLLVLGAAIGVISAVSLLAWLFGRDQRLKRRIGKLSRYAIADAPENEDLRVSGRLAFIDGRSLEAPLSGRACAAWRIIVRERRGRGKDKRWVTLVEEEESIDFALEDGDARAVVDGDAVTLAVDFDDEGGQGALFTQSTPRFDAFLAERGIPSKEWIFSKRLEYREGVLAEGETVTVAASGTWENDPGRIGQGYRDVGKRLRLNAMSDGDLLASDDPDLAR
jgi:hypothetical protein